MHKYNSNAMRYLDEKDSLKKRVRLTWAIYCLIAIPVFFALTVLAADAFRFWWWG